jgi:hypothetical protein
MHVKAHHGLTGVLLESELTLCLVSSCIHFASEPKKNLQTSSTVACCDSVSAPMHCRYGVALLNSYNTTVGLLLGHIFHPLGQVQDCLHYCSPGIPEVRANPS